MEQRRLGADGPEVSVLGIGTAPIGSDPDWIDWPALLGAARQRLLTDDFSVDALEPDDFRRRSRLAVRSDEIERHRAEAHAQGRTLRRHAIAWVLDQPGVTAAIVGVRDAHEGAELAALAGE